MVSAPSYVVYSNRTTDINNNHSDMRDYPVKAPVLLLSPTLTYTNNDVRLCGFIPELQCKPPLLELCLQVYLLNPSGENTQYRFLCFKDIALWHSQLIIFVIFRGSGTRLMELHVTSVTVRYKHIQLYIYHVYSMAIHTYNAPGIRIHHIAARNRHRADFSQIDTEQRYNRGVYSTVTRGNP